MEPPRLHQPVLLAECLHWLAPRAGATIVDATVGTGGHAEPLLERIGSAGRLLGLDRDGEALRIARRRLDRFGGAVSLLQGDYRELSDFAAREGLSEVDGVLLDLGVSSLQLDEPRRGFSFRGDGPLDMRMDRTRGTDAARLLAEISEADLRRVLRDFGEERKAAAIARAIVRHRSRAPIERTTQLARLVERVVGRGSERRRIHPATRTFQALRIAVNRELEGLDAAVADAVELLGHGGRLVVLAYHSLEDRIVKRSLRALAHRCVCPPRLPLCSCGRRDLVRILTPRPLRPSAQEIAANRRARSARLRAVERL